MSVGSTERSLAAPRQTPDAAASSSDQAGHAARTWHSIVYALVGYSALSLFVWSGIWTTHPTAVTTCGCGDNSLVTWFLAWPAYALEHGLNPFFSTFANHPQGVNLLANASSTGIGIVFAPITWLFGPVASLNVALSLSPVLSALATFILVRRWVRWAPAAFVAGLLYGFSPFLLVSLSNVWLMMGMAPVPPLLVLLLDELLFRQRRNPIKVGVGLGLLIFLQFFLGVEMLLIMAISVAIGLVFIVVFAAWREKEALKRHWRHAVVGLAWGVGTSVVLLAYPAWFALAGPDHLSGQIWGGLRFLQWNTNVKDFFLPAPGNAAAVANRHLFGGYQGPFLSNQYIGFGLALVLVLGIVIWRRDRKLWLFGAIGFCLLVISLGSGGENTPLPWRAFANAPLLQNIWPTRFLVGTYLAMAIMLGLILDHVYEALRRRSAVSTESRRDRGRYGASIAALGVAAIALLPVAIYIAQGLPVSTRAVTLPHYFQDPPSSLEQKDVLLVFPPPNWALETAMTWQAVGGMPYSVVGVGGPGGEFARLPVDVQAGAVVIGSVASPYPAPPPITATSIEQVRQALAGWGVTKVVVPNDPHLPGYERIPSTTEANALIAAATGNAPSYERSAWVWDRVAKAVGASTPTASEFSRCVSGLPPRGVIATQAAVSCVLGGER
jgi:hypothetical protein